MDIALIKTFIEVANSGSFVASADRLFVTQSAVSLRIKRLEDELGKALFVRNRAGAELTNAGREFERYAMSLSRIWEEARQQVAIPDGFTETLTIGAQYSLWPRLGFRWIDAMQAARPSLSLRAEIGMPDRLTRFLMEGTAQAALMYMPQLRPGLRAEEVLAEELVMVASYPEAEWDTIGESYVFVDWGPEFVGAHALELPHLTNPGLTLSLGALAAEYVVNRRAIAYLPARYVKPYLDAGRMHLVPTAPRFPYPVWAVWRDDLDPAIRQIAVQALEQVAANAETDSSHVLNQLDEISDEDIDVLGMNPDPITVHNKNSP